MRETPPLDSSDLLYRSREEIRALQNQRFRHQIELCFRAHPYYQELFRRLKLTPDDFQTVEDVQKLPVTTKQDYLSNPEAFRLVALPEFSHVERTLWDITYTTGTTTGIPAPLFNTTYDFLACLEQFKRLAHIVGLTAQDTVVNLYPLTPFPHLVYRLPYAVTTIGAAVVSPLATTFAPASPIDQSMDETLRIIERHKGSVLCGVGSSIRQLLMRAEEVGADFSHVRLVLVAGEACPQGTREEMRQRLWHLGANRQALAIKSGLGFTEMQGSVGECVELSGGHHPAPDQSYFQVLDERSHTPVADGTSGLFTITHLDRRGTVLLRYATGDVNALSHEVCPHCGRQGPRVITNTIRTVEQLFYNGAPINPDLMKEAITAVQGVAEYQVVLTKERADDLSSPDILLIRVAAPPDEQERLRTAVMTAVMEIVQIRPAIEFVSTMSNIFDPQQRFKANRVVDLRP